MSATRRIFALAGIVGPILFGIIVFILGNIRPGYNHLVNYVSGLGAAGTSYAIAQNLNFVVLGVLIVVFSVGLHRGIGEGRGSPIGPILIGAFGVSAIVSGFFTETPLEPGSFSAMIHTTASSLGGTAAIIGIIVISDRLKKDPPWRRYQIYSIVTGISAPVVSTAGFALLPTLGGLVQRTLMAILLLWIVILAIQLYRLDSGDRTTHDERAVTEDRLGISQ